MTPERYRRIEEVFHQVCERDPDSRKKLLATICPDDEDLRAQVEAMLAADEHSPSFLEQRPDDVAANVLAVRQPRSLIGETLGEYRVMSRLGAGGMGEVFVAQDIRLGRKAALKLLPEEHTSDQIRLRRFEQEACAASALSHPNIVTVYGLGRAGAITFLATELVDGRTLRQKLLDGPLPVQSAIEIAIQTAQALAAAHGAGIVHRDIKPENIIVRADGLTKVLDFGIARWTDRQHSVERSADSSAFHSLSGSLVGTPRYMSPEQARGLPVDGRTDLFSLGAVLYELVSGRPAQIGETPSDILASILARDPPQLEALCPECPRALVSIVDRALKKDCAKRYQTADGVISDLTALQRSLENGASVPVAPANIVPADSFIAEQLVKPSSHAPAGPGAQTFRWLTPLFIGIAVLLGMVFAYRLTTPESSVPNDPLTAIPLTSYAGFQDHPTFSPEGDRIAFSWSRSTVANDHGDASIYVKQIGSNVPIRLTSNSEGDYVPAWSLDGKWIAFLRLRDVSHVVVAVIPAIGGPVRELTTLSFDSEMLRSGRREIALPFLAWSRDSQWLLALDGFVQHEPVRIVRIALQTGDKKTVMTPPAKTDGDGGLALSANGRTLAFVRSILSPTNDIYTVPVSDELIPTGTPVRQLAVRGEVDGLAWAPHDDGLVFVATLRGKSEFWQTSTVRSGPVRVLAAGDDPGNFAISGNGQRLVYTHRFQDGNIWNFDLSGSRQRPTKSFSSSTRFDARPAYSPDGKHIALESNRSGNEEIWRCEDDDPATCMQLTSFGHGWSGSPQWSPDSQSIAFDSNVEGGWNIYVVSSKGGKPLKVVGFPGAAISPIWSHDGKWIYYTLFEGGDAKHSRVMKASPDGSTQVQLTNRSAWGAFDSQDGADLYFNDEAGLWKKPVDRDQEIRVSDSIDPTHTRSFALSARGVYFVSVIKSRVMLKFLSFRNYTVRNIADLPSSFSAGISLSPDRRSLLYGSIDSAGSELMMIDQFRQ